LARSGLSVRSLRAHPPLLLICVPRERHDLGRHRRRFRQQSQLTLRNSHGFREFETIELALYRNLELGNLPESEGPQILLRRQLACIGESNGRSCPLRVATAEAS
jgi:hypothetical protein